MLSALAQINSTVGDLSGNSSRIVDFARRAAERGAELVVFPELALTGYPPRDLLEKQSFLERTEAQLHELAAATAALSPTLIVGTVTTAECGEGNHIYNSAAVLSRGNIIFRQNKMLLPTYDVFAEARYFRPADSQSPLVLENHRAGLVICEDAWNDKNYWERRRYSRDPIGEMARTGVEFLVSINASPYHMGKRTQRREIFSAAARNSGMPLLYVNQVGGNDQLVCNFLLRGSGSRRYRDRPRRPACELQRRMRSGIRSARGGNARLHPQVRLLARPHRVVRWHRLVAGGRHCGGRGGPRKCHRGRDARPVFLRP